MEHLNTCTLKKLEKATSIYDVITILFQSLTTKSEQKNIALYNKWLLNPEKAEKLAQIVQMMSGHPADDFEAGLSMLIQLYKENQAVAIPLMVETLLCFDNELSALSGNRQHKQLNHGPLNSAQCQNQEEAYLYIAARNTLQDDFLTVNKLRRGGKRMTPHPSGLQNKLQNYTVIPQNKLGGLIPQISAYYLNETAQRHLQEAPLRIAVFPFRNRMWFDWPHTESDREFDIVFPPEQDDIIVQAYIQALKLAEQQRSHIVIFPEMAYSPKAKEQIRMYLRSNALKTKHIKLIFAGTEWADGVNTAYILSASGRSLLSQKKREPVDFYDTTAKLSRRERLEDHSGNLCFLDVVGLGRIAYAVCRDFIDTEEQLIRGGYMNSGFIAASCYTPELGPFQTTAEGLAKQYGIVSLVCNACASLHDRSRLQQKAIVGFLAIPTCNEKKELLCDTITYCPLDAECTESSCELCSCAYFYTLNHPSDGSGLFQIELDSRKLEKRL